MSKISLVESGPAVRTQIPALGVGTGAVPSNNIFVHTASNFDIGLGYFPVIAKIYTSTHSANFEIGESTVEYANFNAWRGAVIP